MEGSPIRVFDARRPGLAANLAQFGWACRPAHLLQRLEDHGDAVVIRTRDGAEHVLRRGGFRCTSHRTRVAGRVFVIRTDDGRTIRLAELAGTLPDGDWDVIADEVLRAEPSALASLTARAGIAVTLGMLLGALTTGFIGGVAGLDAARTRLGSPLSLAAVAAWAALVWLALGCLSRPR